jgi:hypothetical protein
VTAGLLREKKRERVVVTQTQHMRRREPGRKVPSRCVGRVVQPLQTCIIPCNMQCGNNVDIIKHTSSQVSQIKAEYSTATRQPLVGCECDCVAFRGSVANLMAALCCAAG